MRETFFTQKLPQPQGVERRRLFKPVLAGKPAKTGLKVSFKWASGGLTDGGRLVAQAEPGDLPMHLHIAAQV